MKTLGEIAHDAGAKAGRWPRQWRNMLPSQRQEWEALAQAVVEAYTQRQEQQDQLARAQGARIDCGG